MERIYDPEWVSIVVVAIIAALLWLGFLLELTGTDQAMRQVLAIIGAISVIYIFGALVYTVRIYIPR